MELITAMLDWLTKFRQLLPNSKGSEDKMFGLGGKIAVGMGVLLVAGSGLFYWYYKSSQNEIKVLTSNNATLSANVSRLEGAIEEQNATIVRLEDRRSSDQETILRLSNQFNDARDEVARLRETFSKHDLNQLSIAKPGLIENIINRGTAAEGREFIELTNPRKELPEETTDE